MVTKYTLNIFTYTKSLDTMLLVLLICSLKQLYLTTDITSPSVCKTKESNIIEVQHCERFWWNHR